MMTDAESQKAVAELLGGIYREHYEEFIIECPCVFCHLHRTAVDADERRRRDIKEYEHQVHRLESWLCDLSELPSYDGELLPPREQPLEKAG